jgi:hemerythrin-like domain-containing protein
MKPTEDLVNEHKVISHVLESAAQEAARIGRTCGIRPDLIEKLLDFFRGFADKCHHAKEEKHLFPLLEMRGMAHDSGPIAVMLSEHAEGRQRLANIADLLPAAQANDQGAITSIAENLSGYAALLQSHIEKENKVLFPLADKILSGEDQKELEEEFDRVEKIETGEGVHEKYHQLAHEIADYPKN